MIDYQEMARRFKNVVAKKLSRQPFDIDMITAAGNWLNALEKSPQGFFDFYNSSSPDFNDYPADMPTAVGFLLASSDYRIVKIELLESPNYLKELT